MTPSLDAVGWNVFSAGRELPQVPGGCSVARVAIQHRNYYVLYSEYGELRGETTGKMYFMAEGPHDLPAVGDWVVIHARPAEKAATMIEVLPRKSVFVRQAPGKKTAQQIVAANVDKVFLVVGLDGDFNLRRLERYLTVAAESGAEPVIVLNKTDVCANLDELMPEVLGTARGVSVVALSALRDDGLESLSALLPPGVTGALLGSSGVGKSTIINHLLHEDRMKTREVRATDDHGRHTTTHRELVLLPTGGLLIDTPGLRELQLWSGDEGIHTAFDDVEELAAQCRFTDCRHDSEPGCAVRAALEEGVLDEARYQSYVKLQKEIAYQNRRMNKAEQLAEKQRMKAISKAIKQYYRNKK
jgi:ribosome biogenesis GTPase